MEADISKFRMFWDLMDVIQKHGYLRSAMSVVGRSTVGAWWTIKSHDELNKKGSDLQRRKLHAFYSSPVRDWKNIRDFQSFSQKLMIGAMYLKYVGQCAYHILRDANGTQVRLDFLPGFVMPNVDEEGRLKSPAFIQYPSRRLHTGVHFDGPRDIVYVTNPEAGRTPAMAGVRPARHATARILRHFSGRLRSSPVLRVEPVAFVTSPVLP